MATFRLRSFLDGDGVTTGEVHWGAVFAGVIVSLVGQVLLTMLGAGLGAASFDPATEGDRVSGETIAMGAYIWWAIAGLACAFAGGWAAGWVAGSADRVDRLEGAWQAFLAWATTTLIVAVFVLVLAAGSAFSTRLGGPWASLGSPVGVAAETVDRAAQGSPAAQEEVADATAQGMLWSFFVLIIGAALAIGGGHFGVSYAKRIIASEVEKRAPTVTSARVGPVTP